MCPAISKKLRIFVSTCILLIIACVSAPSSAIATVWQDKVDPWVVQQAEKGKAEFIVFLTEQADLSGSALLATKREKGKWVFERLTAVAERTQKPLVEALQSLGVEFKPYWVSNMIWVHGDMETVTKMALRSDVARIHANPAVRLQRPAPEEAIAQPFSTTAVEWNISHVNAPAVWAAGYTGQGVVIGGQDTGYQWDHPALINQYRGWSGSAASHDYNWHDAIHSGGGLCGADSPFPCDDSKHGTHTMGTMVGDDGGSNQIGMAPGARWIGCRNMNQGVGSPATYAECYQWFMAPTRIDGSAPNPAMAPDMINNSWGCTPSEGCTNPNVLLTVVENVWAAGIMTVQSAGNSGAACSTVDEPAAIYQSSFSVGATNSSDVIAYFSSRGPVTIDGSGRLKPDIVAPGVDIRSCVPEDEYQSGWNGTSMAAPHVAGLAALLVSANPFLAGQAGTLEDIIRQTAVPLTTTQRCGGDGSSDVPNNVYGWGRIDAQAAYNASVAKGSLMVTISPQAAIDAGAQWRVDQGEWRNSGQTASNLLIGRHQLELKAAPPWKTPPNRSVTISALKTTAINVSYSAKAFSHLYLLLMN
jgi:subtilisin family serine protease